jgi:glutaredoxin
MSVRVLIFTQPGCLSCELMKIFLEAHEIVFEEHDVSTDREARRTMIERYETEETPMLVVISGGVEEVILGFDPVRIDQLLAPTSSSNAVNES